VRVDAVKELVPGLDYVRIIFRLLRPRLLDFLVVLLQLEDVIVDPFRVFMTLQRWSLFMVSEERLVGEFGFDLLLWGLAVSLLPLCPRDLLQFLFTLRSLR